MERGVFPELRTLQSLITGLHKTRFSKRDICRSSTESLGHEKSLSFSHDVDFMQ